MFGMALRLKTNAGVTERGWPYVSRGVSFTLGVACLDLPAEPGLPFRATKCVVLGSSMQGNVGSCVAATFGSVQNLASAWGYRPWCRGEESSRS